MANLKGDTVSTGHYWNRCVAVDGDEKKFETYSFWGKASDCEFDDGTNAQDKLGNMKGFTSSTDVTETGYAADASVVSDVYNRTQVNDVKFVFDYQNGKYGYNTDPNRGADTFFPFSEIEKDKLLDALKYSGIDIDINGSVEDIYSAISETFGDSLMLWGRYDNRNGGLVLTLEEEHVDLYSGEIVLYGDGAATLYSEYGVRYQIVDNFNNDVVYSYYDKISITADTDAISYIYFDKEIDLTLYNKLNIMLSSAIAWDENYTLTFGCTNTLPDNGSYDDWKMNMVLDATGLDSEGALIDDTHRKTSSLDISEIVGKGYICIALYNIKYASILEVELV